MYVWQSRANNVRQVSLAYTITAGFAVGIVVIYYVSVYLPDGYTSNAQNAEPNPIDYYLLYWRLDAAPKASQTNARWNKVQVALQHVSRLPSTLSSCAVSLTFAGHAPNKRPPADHWLSHHHLWIYTITMWYICVPLSKSCPVGLVF